MDPARFPADGDLVAPDALEIPKARDVVSALASGLLPFMRLVEARRTTSGDEVVVFDVEPEVPQRPSADIRRKERIAATFFNNDETTPHVAALRRDFPRNLPHVNREPVNRPASLCLYEDTWSSVRLRWTPPAFLRRVHEWLTETAFGRLHQGDQPLEPFIITYAARVVLPPSLYELTPDDELVVRTVGAGDEAILVATRARADVERESGSSHLLVRITTPNRVHGAIHSTPTTLAELADLLASTGADIISSLRQQVAGWSSSPAKLSAQLLLLVVTPKTRVEGGTVEGWDVWAFRPSLSILELGEAIGVWTVASGSVALRGTPDDTRRGTDVAVEALLPLVGLSPKRAASLSGVPPDETPIVAVGCGMLGSQVIVNLARAGFGRWLLIDNDHLLPHNLVRHAAFGADIGAAKARIVTREVNGLFHEEQIARYTVANALGPRQAAAINEAAARSELILDLSAAPAVARHLAIDVPNAKRVMSLFLTPSGRDLVFLGEDHSRTIRLDDLEMQHYRAAYRDAALQGHLEAAGKHLRYGASCRDVTLPLAQTNAAIFSGIGARVLRSELQSESAAISIWRLQDDSSVTAVKVKVERARSAVVHTWTMRADDGVLKRLHTLRRRRLPTETGGALIGHRDMQRRILYVVHALPAPKDSQEGIAFFERGCEGLQEELSAYARLTGGALTYIGEWHSHPPRHSVTPSDRDRRLFEWLRTRLQLDGVPPVMAIVGDNEIGMYVSEPNGGALWNTRDL